MQNPDTTTYPNPFNFVPMPRDIDSNEYSYWVGIMRDLYYDSGPTLAYLEGEPTTFTNLSFQEQIGKGFQNLTPDHLLELIIKDSNLTAEELIDKAFKGEVIFGLSFELESISFHCNMIPLRLGNKIVGYKFQILNSNIILEEELEREREITKVMRLLIAGLTHDTKNNIATINISIYIVIKLLRQRYGEIDQSILDKLEKVIAQASIISTGIDNANGDIVSTVSLNNQRTNTNLRTEVGVIKLVCDDLIKYSKPNNSDVSIDFIFKNIPESFTFITNVDGFERILLNLIGNAIRYSKENTDANITVTFEIINNNLQISVEDSGIGIPADFAESIFKKFSRASNAKALRKGTGVGLMIVKMFTDNLRGNISYASILDVGTVFTVSLPLNLQIESAGFIALDEA